jgi:flavodoxin
MKTAVIYFSKTGNNKIIGQALAKGIDAKAYSIEEYNDFSEDLDMLFLGGSSYFGSLNKNLVDFIKKLDYSHVKKVCLFSTNCSLKDHYLLIKEQVEMRGIPVIDEHFFAQGKWMLSAKGHPNEEEIKKAEDFSKQVISLYK